ncbi:hypothetical protein VUR80DRAFT_4198 [Thermomyces stellatus]
MVTAYHLTGEETRKSPGTGAAPRLYPDQWRRTGVLASYPVLDALSQHMHQHFQSKLRNIAQDDPRLSEHRLPSAAGNRQVLRRPAPPDTVVCGFDLQTNYGHSIDELEGLTPGDLSLWASRFLHGDDNTVVSTAVLSAHELATISVGATTSPSAMPETVRC